MAKTTNTDQPALTSDRYLAVRAILGQEPITLIEQMRAERMSFRSIANNLAFRSGMDVSFEAVRRWYRAVHPEAPQRRSRVLPGAEPSESPEPPELTLDELAQVEPATAQAMRRKLGVR